MVLGFGFQDVVMAFGFHRVGLEQKKQILFFWMMWFRWRRSGSPSWRPRTLLCKGRIDSVAETGGSRVELAVFQGLAMQKTTAHGTQSTRAKRERCERLGECPETRTPKKSRRIEHERQLRTSRPSTSGPSGTLAS